MNRHSVNWKGYIPAITTPYSEDGELDWKNWGRLLNWLVDEGMHGIVINGTTGEWFSQSFEEQKKLFKEAAKHIQNRIPVIAGCTAYTAEQVVELAKVAYEKNLSGILVALPPYIVPTEDEILNYFQYISDHVELPICIYNWPRGTNVDLSIDLVKKLCKIDKVVAIKNSTPDFGHFINTFFAVKDDIRYFGFPMNEVGYHLIKTHGGDGTMGAGAILGRVHPDFYNYLWKNEKEKALENGAKDGYLFRSFFNTDFSGKVASPQAITKEALNLRGLPGGYPRPPILPLTSEQRETVKAILNKIEGIQL
ncbi:dihydrodipicolinate synthase family protein [Virgibacillus halodenitrificans]|uniref:dihydrodipicolinate synthase family protein n=1 Tax=Virgibacillus halodenitrificans TaxID=1482 RepID=UPI000311AE86|nr:dihydrodipicolinate synthase family protein [Virgibacillus halodenitrificans]